MKKILLLLIFYIIFINAHANAGSRVVPFTSGDRDRMIRVEVKIEEIDKRFEQLDKRFEQIDKRFEQLDKRFEQLDKRFEQIDKRFEQMMNFLWMLVAIFLGITATTIGFAMWDRISMIRPFENKVKSLEDTDRTLIEVLKDLSKEDKKLASVLRGFGLL